VARLLGTIDGIIANEPRAALDCVDVVGRESFERMRKLRAVCYVLLAVQIGGTRLIDNALIEEAGGGFQIPL